MARRLILVLALVGAAIGVRVLLADRARRAIGPRPPGPCAGAFADARVECLGNPPALVYGDGEGAYACNVWALHAYDGRLYIGTGNSSNEGPARNAGPVPVLTFDPATGAFASEGALEDEQIDVFFDAGGELMVPGHDPREDWSFGNLHRRDAAGRWTKWRTIPRAIHAYALAWDGRLLAGLGTDRGSAVAVSRDRGQSWAVHPTAGERIHALVPCGGAVYAVDVLVGPHPPPIGRYVPTHEIAPGGVPAARPDLDARAWMPGVRLDGTRAEDSLYRLHRATGVGGACAYIGGRCHNDHQIWPLGVFVARSLARGRVDVRPLPLPEGSRPWDLMVREGVLHVLIDRPAAGGARRIGVLASPDLATWQDVLSFDAPTFARSFAALGGDLYFGLGCEVADTARWTRAELHPAAGQLLRVRLGKAR